MTKITNQSGLTANNLLLNIVELPQRSTISITATNSTTGTISDTANQFISAGFAVGDRIRIVFSSPSNTNNGYATITTLAAGSIGISSHTGTLTTQAAGSPCNIQRVKNTFQFVAVDGLNFVDGVSLSALASELQTLWDTGTYDKYDFPYSENRPDAETLNFISWEPHNANTLNSIRDGAIIVSDAETGAIKKQYMNVNSAPLHGTSDRPWYWQSDGGAITDTVTSGYVNQLVLIQDVDASIDRRNYFKIKTAEPGKTVIVYDLVTAQSIEQLAAKPYRIDLPNQLDLVLANPDGSVKVSDGTIASNAIYTGITYTRHSPDASRTVEGVSYGFSAIVNTTGKTKEQVHTKLNYLIRQKNTDIDSGAGTLLGGYSPSISTFVGPTITYGGYADNFLASESNDTIFLDSSGTARRFDTVAAFSLNFTVEPYLGGATAKFKVFLASVYNTSDATAMLDKDSAAISGTITGNDTRAFSLKYSTFNQSGHPPGTPIPVVITLSAPGKILPLSENFTIQENTTQTFQIRANPTTAYRAAV